MMDMGIHIGGIIWDSRTNEFEDSTDVTEDIDYVEEDDINSDAQEIDPSTISLPNNSVDGRKEKGVYNILLLGEEAIGQGAGRGRTDVIVIATMNTNDNTVKLTSLMRDQLVNIPGFKDNKLNVAYEEGGIDLLYDTIAINFNLHIDGSVLVKFKDFENIVDELGGLEITLTSTEAKYLNTTNYISDPANRKVVEGPQIMNGNQVLGYSRVRKRAAITGKNNDYGRTDRHRIVLNAIFEKCKSMDKAQLASLMYKFLPMITTNIDKKNFQALLDAYIKTGAKEVQQLRIPADDTFKDNVKVRGMSVLIPDYEKNISILHEFIFGDKATINTGN
jgi:LCP family protein required for cell wall assembly